MASLHERASPANRLSEAERQAALAMLNGEEFKNLPPSQIVPRLADQIYCWDTQSTIVPSAASGLTRAGTGVMPLC